MGLYLLTPDKVCEVLMFGTEDRPGSAKWSPRANRGLYLLLHIKFYWDTVKLVCLQIVKGYCGPTTARLGNCNRDLTACYV